MPVETKRKRTSMSLRDSSSNKRRESTKARAASTRASRASSPPDVEPEVKKEEKKEEAEAPTSFSENGPLPSMTIVQKEDSLPSKEWKSVAESGVLHAAFDRSRDKMLAGDLFEKFWTKPTKKKQVDKSNPPKECMNKIGECTMTIHPHIFEVKLYSVRDKEKEKQRELQQQQLLAQQHGRTLQPSTPSTTQTQPPTPQQGSRTPAPVATNNKHNSNNGSIPESSPGQAPPLQPAQTPRQTAPPNGFYPPAQQNAPSTTPQPSKPTPGTSAVQQGNQNPGAAVPPSATPKPQSGQPAQVQPAPTPQATPRQSQTQQQQPVKQATQTQTPVQQQQPPQPQQQKQQAVQTPLKQGSQPGQGTARQPQQRPNPPRAPPPPPTPQDPVIQLLASKASSDPELKALMRVVASGQASTEQLKTFQGHIDVLTPLARAQAARQRAMQNSQAAGRASPAGQQTPARSAQTTARPAPATTPSAGTGNNAQANVQRPGPQPAAQTPLQAPHSTPQSIKPTQAPQGSGASAQRPPVNVQIPQPLQHAAAPASNHPVPLQAKSIPQTSSQASSSSSQTQPAQVQGRPQLPQQQHAPNIGRGNSSQPRTYNTAPRQKALSAADKKHLDICSVVFEFTISSSGDRFLLPKDSILEYRSNGCELLLSYIFVHEGFFQPITLKFTSGAARYLEPISRVTNDRESVLKHMTELMSEHKRASYGFLMMRLKKDEKEIKAAEEAEVAAKKRVALEEDQSYGNKDSDGGSGILGVLPDAPALNSKSSGQGSSKPKPKFKKATFAQTNNSTSASPPPSTMTPLPPKPKIKIPRSRKGRIADPSKSCHICNTSNTSLWRKADIDGESVTVCNACGIKWKTNEAKKLSGTNPTPDSKKTGSSSASGGGTKGLKVSASAFRKESRLSATGMDLAMSLSNPAPSKSSGNDNVDKYNKIDLPFAPSPSLRQDTPQTEQTAQDQSASQVKDAPPPSATVESLSANETSNAQPQAEPAQAST